ncbi:hypothetical protein [Salibacterium salarium]|nr:hypothetical protein [Salibacterium salarium]
MNIALFLSAVLAGFVNVMSMEEESDERLIDKIDNEEVEGKTGRYKT